MNPSKPFAESSEQNKQDILAIIQPLFSKLKRVLEIASGTGQHAVYFSQVMPHLNWQPSDLDSALPGIQNWVNESGLENLNQPIALDVSSINWPQQTFDAIFSANSLHIMSQQHVKDLFSNVGHLLNANGLITVYGPFNYHGQFSSESNRHFDGWLKSRNPNSGIKEFEWCNELAESAGFKLIEDYEMPQNNRILVWQKTA
jgi:cyclopropane fatty-acyl-phospholipid synthase-like methyltransferase